MNKLMSRILIVLICLSAVLTGCTEANEPSNASPSNQNTEAQLEENKQKDGQNARKRPDMFGRVKSIIGNEVILEIAEMPQTKAGKGENQGEKAAGSTGGAGNGGGKGEGKGSQGAGMRELKLTGETATLLIPVGIPISTRSQNGMSEIDLADIYVGSTLSIWFEDNDAENKAITRVMMMQGR
ncbi:hypothetical protein R9X47_08180 [Wukongibacter baidiensis]|uniref:hypothetical protein n=1 Tax=Wukongibacter baidiensis TaxID=1723361 RepID=UPI003D7FFA37